MRRIEPYFPRSHGVPRVDNRRVVSGIVFVIRNGLRWRDAPAAYGPHKTIYNRFIGGAGASGGQQMLSDTRLGGEGDILSSSTLCRAVGLLKNPKHCTKIFLSDQ